ncbi:hypothetical protein [Streptomyces noursei]|uniref:hypothetical protein n=1 Tax=Streptomyces noursei TaxID=1971 RepID=UPI0030F14FD6
MSTHDGTRQDQTKGDSRWVRRLLYGMMAVLAAAATSTGLMLAKSPQASAQPAAASGITCNFTGSGSFESDDPGVFKVQATGQTTSCAGDPAITGATGKGSATFSGSCVTANGPVTLTVKWSNGQTSTITGTGRAVATGDGGATITLNNGMVTSGRYAGGTVGTTTIAVAGVSASCLNGQFPASGSGSGTGVIAAS